MPERSIDQWPKCNRCSRYFKTALKLRKHQTLSGHCYCQLCNVHFAYTSEHLAHIRLLSHAEQFQCCDCKREYMDQQALTTHCCVCDRIYGKKSDIEQHVASSQKHVRLALASRSEPYLTGLFKCSECRETFDHMTSLSTHKKLKHKPQRRLLCPIGNKCKRRFASASALLNHLESGSCKSGMNRKKLNQFIVDHDHENHITCHNAKDLVNALPKPHLASSDLDLSSWQNGTDTDVQMVLTPASQNSTESRSWDVIEAETAMNNDNEDGDDDNDDDSTGGVLLTPSTGSILSEFDQFRSLDIGSVNCTPNLSQEDLLSLSPSHRLQPQCPLCPERIFSSAKALQMHVQSPAHAPKIFHCPMAFAPNVTTPRQRKPEKQFSTLSGLACHLEAGACRGGMETFRHAFKYVEERLLMLGLGGIKLLVEPKTSP